MKSLLVVAAVLYLALGSPAASAAPDSDSRGAEVCATGSGSGFTTGAWIACTINDGAIIVEVGNGQHAECIGDYHQVTVIQVGNYNNATC